MANHFQLISIILVTIELPAGINIFLYTLCHSLINNSFAMDLLAIYLVAPIFSQSLTTPTHSPQPCLFRSPEQHCPKKSMYITSHTQLQRARSYKCCSNYCISLLTYSDIEDCSAMYADLNESQRTTFIVQTMSACCIKRLPAAFKLCVKGEIICIAAFLKVYFFCLGLSFTVTIGPFLTSTSHQVHGF